MLIREVCDVGTGTNNAKLIYYYRISKVLLISNQELKVIMTTQAEIINQLKVLEALSQQGGYSDILAA